MLATLKLKGMAMLAKAPFVKRVAHSVSDRLRWVQWRIHRPAYPDGKIRLHVGCGDVDYPGFVNIDARPRKHVHHVQGIDDLREFSTESAVLIYGSHCLEHISHVRVAAVLREWHRVLKPAGVLRLSVPDFDLMLDVYLRNRREIESVILPLMGAQDYAFNYHYTCFNFDYLRRLLLEAGFKEPRRWQHGTEPFTSLPDWSGRPITYDGATFPVSLNIEATK